MNIIKEDIYKEIDLIQSCITRMASNSFSMKGWHIGIISALIVFIFDTSLKQINIMLGIILIVTFAFWYLDSYYLMLERKYRWKYSWIIKNRINTDTPTSDYLFNLNPNEIHMWDVNIQSKEYKAAIKTIEAINQNRNKLLLNLRILNEIKIVMFSNTMEVQYLIVFVVSIAILILKNI